MDLTRELQKAPVHGPDYKRISKKQRAYLLSMLDSLADVLEECPGMVTEARAHLMIESIEPHYKALSGILKEYGPANDEDDDDFDPDF